CQPILRRPKTSHPICKHCFFTVFEAEVHNIITEAKLFNSGDRVAIGASGGKGHSTVLLYVLKTLNERHQYGLPVSLFLLSIDEGITVYRDDSLQIVKRSQEQHDIPLKIPSYEELYGWTMDRVVSIMTFCLRCLLQAGVGPGAASLDVDYIVTGHNADDIAETVLMNITRGDIARLGRCTAICTQGEDTIRRSKPFKHAYEEEIVINFSTECIYSPDTHLGHAHGFLKDLEAARPSAIIDIIHSDEAFEVKDEFRATQKTQLSLTRDGNYCNPTPYGRTNAKQPPNFHTPITVAIDVPPTTP
ncbi:hypothetical protein F5148DRAFT_1245984, partial [Russula earlei]